ncbi:MAG: glycosyltransferase family 39 protein [Mycobacterium sp.]
MTLRRVATYVQESRSDRWLVIALVAVGFAVYGPRLAAVTLVDHDDVISIIGATCNQGRYEQSIPTGRWVDAAQWQQYWQWRGLGCYGQISADLAHYDIHPPLYFWLLHTWFGVFGVSILSGLLLNLVILAVTVVVIYTTCRVLAVSRSVTFVVTLAWMLSLPTRTVVSIVRQYGLFSMLTALLLLCVVLWLTRRQGRYAIAIGVVLLAGALTHYQFVLPAGFMLLFALAIQIHRKAYPAIAQLAVAGVAALLLFFVAHPGFLESVSQANRQAQSFSFAAFGQRLGAAIATIFQIFNPLDWPHPLPYGLLDMGRPVDTVLGAFNVIVGLAALVLVVRLAIKAVAHRPRAASETLAVEYLPIFTAVTTWCTVVGLYVLCVSPVHAIGLQYLHFTTPLLFVAVAQLIEKYKDDIPRPVVGSVVPVLLVGAVIGTSVFVWHRSEQQRIFAIRDADALLIDTTEIGVLPAVLWHAAPETVVYAGLQRDLQAGIPVPPGGGSRLVYTSSSSYENRSEAHDLIMAELANAGYRLEFRMPSGVVPLIPLGGEITFFRSDR